MTSAFSWQNSVSLCPASFCTPGPKLPVIPGISWLPTFAFQSPMMKATFLGGVNSGMSCRSSQNYSASVSSALLVKAQTWIIGILNSLPWKQTEIILSFLRLYPLKYCILDSLVDYDGYSISSKEFLSIVVDIIDIQIKFAHSSLFQFSDF